MKKLKLNSLASKSLSETQMNEVKGGRACGCGCAYANSGGSSIDANCSANYSGGAHGLYSDTRDLQCELIDLMN